MNHQPPTTDHQPPKLVKRFEIPIIASLLIAGSIFLLRMAYLKIWFTTPICIAYLWAVYAFVKSRFGIRIPFVLLLLIYLSVALDGLGNLFDLFNTKFRYVQYDEFTHTVTPALTLPLVVWLLRTGLDHFGYRLPLGLVVFFATTTVFMLSGFYEVIELWDDKYLHPTMRIHGPYDTANDLQCDLIGMILGGVLAYVVLRQRDTKSGEGVRVREIVMR
ncbi:MAG: hypothetical protein ACREEM_43750 [Blastocatellia bacterium]